MIYFLSFLSVINCVSFYLILMIALEFEIYVYNYFKNFQIALLYTI